MKKFVIAVVAFFGLGAAVQAADVSSNMLAKMGLGGMQQLSDSQGLAIRGMGRSIEVWGDVTNVSKIYVGTNLGNLSIVVAQNSIIDDIDVDQKNDVDIGVSKKGGKKSHGGGYGRKGRH
jgi:hypothetical protein